MSEQFANLASTTLASGYTAGSGSISVVSAAGFPTQGTFTLCIRDQTTKLVKLLFRVTSVSGTIFTGASEGTDASANAGDLVDGSMVSVAMIAQLKADILASVPPAANPFIQSLTAPVAANFSQINFNTGASVVTTQVNNTSPVTSITLIQNDPGATGEIAGLTKSPIAATFTITIGFAWAPGLGAQGLAGLWLTDGSANNLFLCYQVQTALAIRAPVFTTFAGAFLGDAIGVTAMPSCGPLLWLRIQETASARKYFTSPDGITFTQIFTESNTAHFTTAKYGFAAEDRGGAGHVAMTVYSFTESNP